MALRLLHTADWHLGHTLHGIDRTREHEQILAWLLDTIESEQVDALLVAGDVFDGANPPVEAQRLWARFLVEAWARVEHLQVVVVGGNHDSASRLEVNDPFLHAMKRLHVFGGASRAGAPDLDRLAVPLRDRQGKTQAWVAAVPFLRAAEIGAGHTDSAAESTRRVYGEVVARARAARAPAEALLAIGHLYLVGGRTSELSERKLVIGNQSAVPVDVFPDDLAYVALGHLHLAQTVGGRDRVRYSGSLLPLSLDERRYAHQVLVVDLEGEAVREVRSVHVPRRVELLRVPESGALDPADAVAALAALPARDTAIADADRPLLEVCVRLERPEPALRQKIEAAIEGKAARLVRLGVETAGARRAGAGELRPIAQISPEEVFRRKFDRDFGGEPPSDLLLAFQELHQTILEERG
jgi:exonuclease SbcD